MFVYLKPKKSISNQTCMQNYARITNWHYKNSSAIHCKKNSNESKIEKILMEKVSSNKKSSSSPLIINPENMDLTLEGFEPTETEENKPLDTLQQKMEISKRSTVFDISEAYKKTFKYNTTMYQILKNLNKRNQSQKRRKIKTQQNRKYRKNESSVKKTEDDPNVPSNATLRLDLLENIKKQCLTMETEEKATVCRVNLINLSVDREMTQVIQQPSFTQWRSNKQNSIKLSWKKSLKRNSLRSNSIIQRKLKLKSHPEIIFENNPIDQAFDPLQTYETKQRYANNSISHRKTEPLENIVDRESVTQRKFKSNYEKEFRITKTKQNFPKPGSSNSEFEVEAWKIRERDQEDNILM